MLVEIHWRNQGEAVLADSRNESKEAKDKAGNQSEKRPSRLPYRHPPRLHRKHPGHGQENETKSQASMGQEDEKADRNEAFHQYKVTKQIMAQANKNALFMHSLPAYRGFEVEADVIDGEQSVVWDEAENRLHAQKALLEFLLAPH